MGSMSLTLFTNIFSQPVGCLFVLFMVSFAVQKVLCLIRPHLFIFITLGDGSKMILLDFPGSPVVKTLCFQCLGAQVQSLVMEIRFHMLCSAGKKKDIAVIYVKRVFCLYFPLRSFWFFLNLWPHHIAYGTLFS